jgi:hypothetical protein
MSQPIVAYNQSKLENLQHEIDVIPSADLFDGETEPITLDPSHNNHGSIVPYARGDHTHYLDLSEITVELKTPVKIVDEAGDIKKVLIEKTMVNNAVGSLVIWYLKFPLISSSSTGVYPSVTINFDVTKSLPYSGCGFSHFAAIIRNNNGTLAAVIESSFNHELLIQNTSERKIVYYTEGGINHYYLKIVFNKQSGTFSEAKYKDISTNTSIPADFTYDNMVLITLPGTEVEYATYNIADKNVFLDAVTTGNGISQGIITYGNTNPSSGLSYLYPGTIYNNWSGTKIGETNYYMWNYD